MQDLIFSMTRRELETLVIECVGACLKNATPLPRHTGNELPSGEAGSAFISKREAARLLSCSPSTIDNHARAGHLTRHYIGKAVRFDRVQVLSLAKRHSSTKQRI
jgi:excisionase family DNA binding protein